MIVDTSALLSIVFQESGHEDLIERVQAADVVAAATPTLAETGIVLHARLGEDARGLLERLLDELGVQEIPFGEIHWREAVEAFRRFGKGQHPAGLTFGDCLTYAGAHIAGEALLSSATTSERFAMIGFDGGKGSGGTSAGPADDELARALRKAIARGEIRSDRDAQRFVERFIEAYNARPQDELGGLSPVEASRLLHGDWVTGGADAARAERQGPVPALRLATDLSLDELSGSAYVRRARELIARVDASGGVKATKAGNLPRALVGALLELEDDGYTDNVERLNKVINEADHPRLHITRILLGLARLVSLRKGSFQVSRRGLALSRAEDAGALFALLFDTHFRTFNLAFLDGCPETPSFQQTIAYSLWRFGRLAEEWRTPEEWAKHLLLPAVREEILWEERGWDPTGIIVECRLLRNLAEFGLAEVRRREPAEAEEVALLPPREYRRTALYDRFLAFGV